MDHYELGVVLAQSRIAELRRQADRWRLASRIPGRTGILLAVVALLRG